MILNFSHDSLKPKNGKSTKQLLAIAGLAGFIAIGSTLAANINLNSGTPVEFGQGVAQATACDDSVILTPQATFVNDSENAEFLFTSFSVTDISSACDGKTFTIKAFKNGENSPLNLYQTDGTTTYSEINVLDDGGSFSFADGGLLSDDISNKTGGFTVTLVTAGPPPSVALASAQDVDRMTVESKDTVGGTNPGGPHSLVGLWQFENPSNLGADSLGQIDLAEGSGTPTQDTGRNGIGNAIYFDGNSWLYKSGAINSLPSGNASYTFAAWINIDGDDKSKGGIVSYGNASVNNSNSLRLDNYNTIYHYWYGNDSYYDAGYALAGTWHHVVSSYDAMTSTRSIYIDGLLLKSETAQSLPDFYAGGLFIGKTNADMPFKGKIDEVAIYNFALDSNEILSVKSGTYQW